jgi:hypothetical protein
MKPFTRLFGGLRYFVDYYSFTSMTAHADLRGVGRSHRYRCHGSLIPAVQLPDTIHARTSAICFT